MFLILKVLFCWVLLHRIKYPVICSIIVCIIEYPCILRVLWFKLFCYSHTICIDKMRWGLHVEMQPAMTHQSDKAVPQMTTACSWSSLPYLTFGVGRLLHLPSTEVVSVRPNAQLRCNQKVTVIGYEAKVGCKPKIHQPPPGTGDV